MPKPIDLRSDTVTQPTPAMRKAIASATVGDDVLGDDPTVTELEMKAAELYGKPAALFVPSGTMANQLALRTHTEPGDEIITDAKAHIIHYETGAPAAISGLMIRTVEVPRGVFEAPDVEPLIRHHDIHYPVTRLVSIENTHNRGGGAIWPLETIRAIARLARRHKLKMHLDGARLMNACVAEGCAAKDVAKHFDSATLCLSKGLGAPAGSLVMGDKTFVARARRFRKMFGGAMRQSGLLAAAGLYALEHNIDRLAEDHASARQFAGAIAKCRRIYVNPDDVETNMVYFMVLKEGARYHYDEDRPPSPEQCLPAEDACAVLEKAGVRVLPGSAWRVRAVTHLGATSGAVKRAARTVTKAYG